ncbi:hypothetical protein [Cellvibrio sp. QJXJ]|uniref:hypothetical protein n=1 Tax=Cellvibrio sp. QJXJ TaxID=2964606 RepID=UPI0021C45977|nr:hypothetical protein [Cellvibrio sp. QJXJ]UUA75251.1 hypothetical protein NNX04_22615 [Cellvibrio sp. QJXJ]
MVRAISLAIVTLVISACANNAPVVNQESLSGVLVDSAKSQTNAIGRMRMDGRVNTKMFEDSGIKKTALWFVSSGNKATQRFIAPIGVHCESKKNIFDPDLSIKKIGFSSLYDTLLPVNYTRVLECESLAGVVDYAVLINDDDRSMTEAGTYVAKVQVIAFENTKHLDTAEFRSRYLNIHKQLIEQWNTPRSYQ